MSEELAKRLRAMVSDDARAICSGNRTTREMCADILAAADALSRTPPTGNAEGLREAVAELIDPVVFASWRSMIEHCERLGDPDETALRYANTTYLRQMDVARNKADAILALLPSIDGRREVVEECARVADQQKPQNEPADWTEFARDKNAILTGIAAAIRKISPGDGEGRDG